MRDIRLLMMALLAVACCDVSHALTISGSVIGADGAPLPDAKIVALADGDEVITTKTDSDGMYSFDVKDSKYILVTKRGYQGVKSPVTVTDFVLQRGLNTNYPWLNAVVNNSFAWPKTDDKDKIYVTYSRGESSLNFVYEFDDEWVARNIDPKVLRDVTFKFILTNMGVDGDSDRQTNIDMNIARAKPWLDITVSVGWTQGGALKTKLYKCKDLIKYLRKDPSYTGLHR